MRVRVVVAMMWVGAMAGVGCNAHPASAPERAGPLPSVTTTAEEARVVFENRCVPCHGPAGGGNGPAAAVLHPPPRDLRDAAWQATVTDAQIEDIIRRGGAALGKSPFMPANPDLVARPHVVAALRARIRGLR